MSHRQVVSSVWKAPGDPLPAGTLIKADAVIETDPDGIRFSGAMEENGRCVWRFHLWTKGNN